MKSGTLERKPHPSRSDARLVRLRARASRVTRYLRGTAPIAIVMLIVFSARAGIDISPADAQRIGKRIWHNECGGTISGLTSWNTGEDFASLGIGHFIWYPKGQRGPFEESFPKFLIYAANNRARLPSWLHVQPHGDARVPDCPWISRTEFYKASQTPRMKELRDFLVGTIDVQTGFMVERLQSALPKMIAEAAPAERERV